MSETKESGPEAAPSDDTTKDLPPLRLHATRVPERLTGGSSHSLPSTPSSTPVTTKSKKQHVRRRSLDRKNSNPRSRSKSPLESKQTATTTMDGGSSLSSFEDFVDFDILTDSKGMMELSFKEQETKTHQLHLSSGSLPPVHERMSEETLDDVHAFSDIKTPSLSSRGNSTVGTAGDVGSYLLETLDECEEEDVVDTQGGEVIFTNMENLTIHEEDDSGDGASTSVEVSSTAMAKTV